MKILSTDLQELNGLSQRVGGLVTATYSFDVENHANCEKIAVQIATGQTLGYLPEHLEYYTDYVGRVLDVSHDQGRGRAKIVFPARLFGNDVSGLLTVLFGKISFYPNLKLESIDADETYLKGLQGPRFGYSGIRHLAGKATTNSPLLMAILKPGIGPSDKPLAEQFAKLIDAGTDLVKDDETRIDITLEDSLRRLELVRNSTDGRGIYVTHLTGPAFELKSRALKLQSHGAQAFLFCPFTYGLANLQALCQDHEIKVPIFAHPALTGPLTTGGSSVSPRVVLGKVMRWAGCDAVLFPSPYGSIALSKNEAVALHQALVGPEDRLKKVASVPSAGIMPDMVASIRADFGESVIINAGTGMAKSGDSIEDGARAFLKSIQECFPQ